MSRINPSMRDIIVMLLTTAVDLKSWRLNVLYFVGEYS